jgi:hypothetical protein
MEACLEHKLALGNATADATADELLERKIEVALVAIERQHLRIGGNAGQRRPDGALRDSLVGRLALEGLEPLLEIAAARRSAGGSAGAQAGKQQQGRKPPRDRAHDSLIADVT